MTTGRINQISRFLPWVRTLPFESKGSVSLNLLFFNWKKQISFEFSVCIWYLAKSLLLGSSSKQHDTINKLLQNMLLPNFALCKNLARKTNESWAVRLLLSKPGMLLWEPWKFGAGNWQTTYFFRLPKQPTFFSCLVRILFSQSLRFRREDQLFGPPPSTSPPYIIYTAYFCFLSLDNFSR